MIYLFHGSDVEKTRAKAFEWVAKARAKEPNLAYVRLAGEELTESALEDVALSGGLFVKRLLVLIDDPFPTNRASDAEECRDVRRPDINIEEYIDILVASDNAILILAPKLAPAKAKKIAAKAKFAYEYNLPHSAAKPVRGFNASLVNALASRSRERLWLEVNRALRAGDAPEMLHGLLHWKARDLMDKGSRIWTAQESRKLSLSLISLLQDSRRKNLDFAESLERFSLRI